MKSPAGGDWGLQRMRTLWETLLGLAGLVLLFILVSPQFSAVTGPIGAVLLLLFIAFLLMKAFE